MKRIHLIICSFLFLINFATPQDCPPGNISLLGQSEIDNFLNLYPDCTEIEGNLFISGYSTSVFNLNGLINIISINGNVSLFSTNLVNLSDMANLTTVSGDFIFDSNIEMTSVGLVSLTSIGGNFILYSFFNPNVSTLGLENLTSVDGHLRLEDLTSLSDLINLTTVGGGLFIGNTTVLNDLSGLENLTTVTGGLNINNNFGLTNLSGLENLITVTGNLSIGNNFALTNLSGLENLTTVAGNLSIHRNSVLTDLSGLNSLISIGSLDIIDNSMLHACSISSICSHIANGGITEVNSNSPHCNSIEEVLFICDNNSLHATLFPNPTSGIFLLRFSTKIEGELLLTDYSGKTIMAQRVQQNNEINLSAFATGVYFLSVKTADSLWTERVVKL